MSEGKWLVINIGCIECGVSSNIVGLYDDKNKAVALAKRLGKENYWRENGQNNYEVFELPKLNITEDEYRDFDV